MLALAFSEAMFGCQLVKRSFGRVRLVDLVFPLRSAFLALPLEAEAKWQFQALQAELQPFADCLRFQAPDTPHLTLQFWPELMEIEYHQVLRQSDKIAAGREPFILQVTGANTFGHRGEDHVLFLDVAFSEPLARLKKSCPWPSVRPFAPHITLARVAHPQRFIRAKKRVMKALADCAFELPVDCLRLYAEVDGHKQTPLHDFLFEGSA